MNAPDLNKLSLIHFIAPLIIVALVSHWVTLKWYIKAKKSEDATLAFITTQIGCHIIGLSVILVWLLKLIGVV